MDHVEPRAGDAPGFERLEQRLLVDDRAARGVDEDRARLHQRELLPVHQVRGLRRQGHVERDHVGFAEERLLVHALDPFGLEVLDVVREHAHAERARVLAGHRAEAAVAEDAESLAGNLVAAELVARPFAALGGVEGPRHPAEAGERQRPGQFGGRGDVVEELLIVLEAEQRDPARVGGLQVQVIQHGRRAGDDAEFLGGGDRLGVEADVQAGDVRFRDADLAQQRVVIGFADFDFGDFFERFEHLRERPRYRRSKARSISSSSAALLLESDVFRRKPLFYHISAVLSFLGPALTRSNT